MPSAVTPAAMSITAAGRSVPTVNSSGRLQPTRTGRPACRARIAASIADPGRVLAAEPAAGGRDDDPHVVLVQRQRGRDLRPDRERGLGARPHRQPPVGVPGCHRDPGLQGRRGDVRGGVGGLAPDRGALQRGRRRALLVVERTAPPAGAARRRVLAQELGQARSRTARQARPRSRWPAARRPLPWRPAGPARPRRRGPRSGPPARRAGRRAAAESSERSVAPGTGGRSTAPCHIPD